MDRRRFLSATGTAGLSLAVAGCSDSDDSDDEGGNSADDGGDDSADDGGSDGRMDEESDEETDDEQSDDETDDEQSDDETDDEQNEDGADDEEQAAELISRADRSLGEAEDRLEQQLEAVDSDSPEALDPEPIRVLLDETADALDQARPIATAEQQEAIGLLDGVLAFMRDFVEMFLVIGNALEEFVLVESLLEDRQVDQAVSTLESAEASVDEARELFDDARASIQNVDAERLGTLTQLELQQFEENLDELNRFLIGFDLLTTGVRELGEGLGGFTRGLQALNEANTLFDQEAYAESATAFEQAGDQYADANARFSEAVDSFSEPDDRIPQEFLTDIQRFRCQVETFAEAATRFETGSREFAAAARQFEQGNDSAGEQRAQTGQTAFEEGERLSSEADNC